MGASGHIESPLERAITRVSPVVNKVWGAVRPMGELGRPGRVLIVSPEAGAGTTTLAGALALMLSRNLRTEVHLVEGALETPAAAGYLGTLATQGNAFTDGRSPGAPSAWTSAGGHGG